MRMAGGAGAKGADASAAALTAAAAGAGACGDGGGEEDRGETLLFGVDEGAGEGVGVVAMEDLDTERCAALVTACARELAAALA